MSDLQNKLLETTAKQAERIKELEQELDEVNKALDLLRNAAKTASEEILKAIKQQAEASK